MEKDRKLTIAKSKPSRLCGWLQVDMYHKQVKVAYILLHRKEKLTIAKLKSLRLSYNVVVSLPLELSFAI
jgi:hypothetical protein